MYILYIYIRVAFKYNRSQRLKKQRRREDGKGTRRKQVSGQFFPIALNIYSPSLSSALLLVLEF